MIAIKYTIVGKPLERGVADWEKSCLFQLKKQGLPNIPISKIFSLNTRIYYHNPYGRSKGNINNLDNAKRVHQMLINIGVMNDDTFLSIPSTKQQGIHRREGGGVEITLTIDEKSPKNKGLVIDNLPIVI